MLTETAIQICTWPTCTLLRAHDIMANLVATDYPPGACELIRGFITGNEFYRNDDETLDPPWGWRRECQ